jgi:hypothetical protein
MLLYNSLQVAGAVNVATCLFEELDDIWFGYLYSRSHGSAWYIYHAEH